MNHAKKLNSIEKSKLVEQHKMDEQNILWNRMDTEEIPMRDI